MIIPLSTYISLTRSGVYTYIAPIVTFIGLPFFEFIFATDKYNLTDKEEKEALNTFFYDLMVYLMLPFQYLLILVFCYQLSTNTYQPYEVIGMIISLGISCGVLGINVGHELGHRNKKFEQRFAKLLLASSLYSHFFVEHNKGHHRHVSTPHDPASAKTGETIFTFWPKSIYGSLISALKFEKSKPIHKNEVVIWKIFEVALISSISFIFSLEIALYVFIAAIFGILLLETVNYIEHYGLQRKIQPSGRYEKVQPIHSWNSDHILSRFVLFDLSRHSDHHANASRKYQILRTHNEAPQLPSGYPSMILLALVPPLWFKTMDRLVDELEP